MSADPSPPGLRPTKDEKVGAKRKPSESNVKLELKSRFGFRKNRIQGQKVLSKKHKPEESRSSRKRKLENKEEPPKKKALKSATKPGNVIGAVREVSDLGGWQVRTAEGVILQKVFSSKKEAEDVLRSLQKGETKAQDYIRTKKEDKKE